MTNMDDNNEYDPTLNELFNDIQDIVNKISEESSKRLVRCEQILEKLVAEDMVDLLVDDRGYFHYRLTEKGKDTMRVDGFKIGPEPMFINPWRLA